MPKRTDLKKILIIGSGPIVIGQAAEFDYAGTQACLALKEEGYEVVLVNSNPATIMTDTTIADKVYMEPLTLEYIAKILRYERPDAILPGIGGQTGLNLAMQLAKKGILKECQVELLGTSIDSIERAEDRELFKEMCQSIGEPVIPSQITYSVEEAIQAANEIGYPVVLRPAFTLGGTGGGFANNQAELEEIMKNALKLSPVHQVLVEKSVKGYKEIEFEVMRDGTDRAITICGMENIDPVGVHTGDSIVVAPILTLNDHDFHMLRDSALKIIKELKIEGGCNVQFALDPNSSDYYLIEVNPRVSRSSALASKASGYPIARVTAKIAVGMTLDEIKLGETTANYEPALDYIVAKMPRFPFDKFATAANTLSTQMKATGEVMGIGRTLEESLLKSIRSLEIGVCHLHMAKFDHMPNAEMLSYIATSPDDRIYAIAQLIRNGVSLDEIFAATKITKYFLESFRKIVDYEKTLAENVGDPAVLTTAKEMGFSDKFISQLWEKKEVEVFEQRKAMGLMPVYKMIETSGCGGYIPYFYSTYEKENDSRLSDKKKIIVLGSGPIRIGQGVEFDYCSVHCVWSLREMGYETIIINNNPETVSTDFDISDKLYFEPLTVEDVLNVIDKEQPEGVIVQFGGQTAINLAGPLNALGVKVLGSSVDSIDRAEDRERFEQLLTDCNIPRPKGHTVFDTEGALNAAHDVGYPVMVRPSYVLGGRAMEIVYNDEELKHYMSSAVKASKEHPVLVDHYLQGTEVEVDAICDGTEVLIPGIMEHVERAGVHSGDSIAVYPPRNLPERVIETIIEYTNKMALGLEVKGMINIQYIVRDEHVYVIEVNPRSSRTVPFLSKVTGIPMVNVATKCAMGVSLKEQGYEAGLRLFPDYYAVKAPVFSFNKMSNVDITLGPEMKSTGEVMACDYQYSRALYKACIASGIQVPNEGSILMTVADLDKEEAVELAKGFEDLGYVVTATSGTAKYLIENGVNVRVATKVSEGTPNILDDIKAGRINMVINTSNHGRDAERDGFKIRRSTVEHAIACLTSMDTARELQRVLNAMRRRRVGRVIALQDLALED